MPSNLDVSASVLLDEAANMIRSCGWIQGISIDLKTGKMDMLGALSIVSGCRETRIQDDGFPLLQAPLSNRVAALKAWESLDCYLMEDPITWNDHAGRTQREVLNVLRTVSMDLLLGIAT